MSATMLVFSITTVLCGPIATPSSVVEDRPAEVILAEINIPYPRPTDTTDKSEVAAMQELKSRTDAWYQRRTEAIGELYASHPETPELAELLPWRWTGLAGSAEGVKVVRSEAKNVLETSKQEDFHASAYYILAALAWNEAIAKKEFRAQDVMPMVDDLCKRFPKDERGARLLIHVAARVKDVDEQEAIWARTLRDYPGPKIAASVERGRREAEMTRRKLGRVGQPFHLEFVDAIKGTRISMETLKGKVVVLDFWATWCGPCIAEMPRMKKLYAEYKDKGVEFIGVSLDETVEKGGLDKLKDFVAANGIEWPQYYQGSRNSEFSTSWGITGIPSVFLVDTDGNLVSVEARGKLEEMIPKLLGKAKTKTAPTNP